MLKEIINFTENPTIVRYAQTPLGKTLLVLIYALFIFNINTYPGPWQQVILVTVVSATFFPKNRYLWIFIGMLVLLMENFLIRPELDWEKFRVNYLFQIFEHDYSSYFTPGQIKYINILIVLVLSEAFIYLTCRFRQLKLMRYPVTISFAVIFGLIIIAENAALSPIHMWLLWSFIVIYNHYFWFMAYTMIESPLAGSRNYMLDYGRYLPIWGFTELPYGKGSIYLKHVEAKTSEEFAIIQLKAVRLAGWAFILYFVLHAMYKANIYFNIPNMAVARHDYANGEYYTVGRAWFCMWATFFRRMLELTVMGHFIVATCRMLGFRILRNTYKPLQAPTIAEYWNRYNYYFKELLAIFFFYPAFFRFFKNMPKWRLMFATICAASIGNILFHFLLLTPIIMTSGIMKACRGFTQFIFYAFILGIGIGFSQLHMLADKKPKSKFKLYIMSPVLVLFFYSILGVFSNSYQEQSIMVNFRFLASLFNITW